MCVNTQLIQPRADWIPGSHYPDPFAAEIAALPPDRLLASSGGLAVYLAHAREIPALLRETGRLREITFRAAGEGTGQEIDLDRFDAHYQHLILWDAVRGRIAGGYRLCPTDCGAGGLYTATLFQYS
ncbi:MAG: GNAT family N-acetyltransferase, partial [Acidobacteria bacterium]|nr:GNAT family N-acetyltransferase [Acidobacteriota bacterium]